MESCVNCGEESEPYFVLNGKTVCKTCVEETCQGCDIPCFTSDQVICMRSDGLNI